MVFKKVFVLVGKPVSNMCLHDHTLVATPAYVINVLSHDSFITFMIVNSNLLS